jgi:hypothetical protein
VSAHPVPAAQSLPEGLAFPDRLDPLDPAALERILLALEELRDGN